MVVTSCNGLKPFYHHRQTHREFASLMNGIHLRKTKQSKTKKLPVLALARDVCILGSFTIRVYGCLFTLSAGNLPATRSPITGGGITYKGTSCVMNFSTPLPEKATFQGASIITAEFIAVIITPDLVWNEQKGKEKKNCRESFQKSSDWESYWQVFLGGKWVRTQTDMCVVL